MSAAPENSTRASQPVVAMPSSAKSIPGNRAAAVFIPNAVIDAGLRPEEEDRLVEECAAEESRHDEVAALDHLLRDGRMKAFVGIGERRVEQ